MNGARLILLFCILLQAKSFAYSQQIKIYSISAQRQTLGDFGYTLDGNHMISSRQKLLDTFNFGPSGIYIKPIAITDGFETTGSLESVTQLPYSSIFFFGTFNKIDASFEEMTDQEIDSLYKWSKHGGKLIICEQPSVEAVGFNGALLDSEWGFSLFLSPNSNFIPTNEGITSGIFDGPFGTVTTARQGGSSVGYIDIVPPNSIVFAENLAGKPTLILDCNTLDLISADVDGYTDLGGISQGSAVDSPQDKFWANSIAYMEQMETTPAPVITVSGYELSVGNYYVSYQWYLNGVPIPGAQSSNYTVSEEGEYTVEVTYQCGCVVKAAQVRVPEGCSLQCNNLLQATVSSLQFANFSGQVQLIIYNAVGQQLFYSSNYENNWVPPASGIYIYEVQCLSRYKGRGKVIAIL